MAAQSTIRARAALLSLLLSAAAPLLAQTESPEGALPDRMFRWGFDGRPVSGQLVVNGFPMPMPSGSHVHGSHQPTPGVYDGTFYFPSSTLQSNVNGLGLVTLTVQLLHQGLSSTSMVAGGTAGQQLTDLYLQLQSATVSGVPVALGSDCKFGPIFVSVPGSWNATTMTATGNGITIPPVAAGTCAGFSSTLNNSIAGSNNSITINISL
jgi:hypothetical protein